MANPGDTPRLDTIESDTTTGVVFAAARQALVATSPYSSTAPTEMNTALRIEVEPKSPNSYFVCTVSLNGFIASSADIEVRIYYGVGSGSTPNLFFGNAVTGYSGHRLASATSQLQASTVSFIIPNSATWTGTRVLSPFYSSSNGSAVTLANSSYNGPTFKIEEIVE